jgi:hypothetical protein
MFESCPIPGIPDGVASRLAEVPCSLANGVRYSPIGEVADGVLLLHAARIGRYRIYGGNTIDFCVEEPANPFAVDRFLWGNAFAGLIHQRGELPLHASAARSACGKHMVAICGASGAGKSTMAATLRRRGWQFFSDDLTRLTAGETEILAWPGPAAMRLRTDALEHLDIDKSEFAGDGETGKLVIGVPRATGPGRLTQIIALGGQEAAPRLELLSGGAALAALVPNICGPRKLRALGRPERHFAFMRFLLAHCPVYRLHGRRTASAEVLSRVICDSLG